MTTKTVKRGKNLQPLVTADELHRHRMGQLMHVFGQADSTLAGHRVSCELSGSGVMGSTPAQSGAGRIQFNADMIGDVNTVEGLIKVNGLNYHELSHILFTPQRGKLLEYVNGDGTFVAFNVLEDQRIEMLLVQMYPSVAPYLIATVAEYFADVANASDHYRSWPYLYGRKYLPSNMRNYFHTEAFDPKHGLDSTMKMCERIIDKYTSLDPCDPANTNKARKLIQDFSNIIGTTQQFSPFGHQGAAQAATGGSGGNSSTNGKQSANAKKAQGAPGAGGGSGPGAGGGLGNGGGDSTDPNAAPIDKSQAKRGLKAIAQKQHGSAIVQNDVRRQREAMKRGRRLRHVNSKHLRNSSNGESYVNDSVRRTANAFSKQLKQLVVDNDPGWHTHQPSGRINVQRAMQGGEIDTVFDMWEGGKQDADSIELVVMGDISGSMQTIIQEVGDVLWMFKYGCDQISNNTSTTVMLFDTGTRIMYGSDERAKPHTRPSVSSGGGTNPAGAIDECKRIMGLSKKKHKIALFVTDGAWSGSYDGQGVHDDNIQLLNEHGVITSIVFMMDEQIRNMMDPNHPDYSPSNYGDADWRDKQYRHNAQTLVFADTPASLSMFGRKLVKSVVRG